MTVQQAPDHRRHRSAAKARPPAAALPTRRADVRHVMCLSAPGRLRLAAGAAYAGARVSAPASWRPLDGARCASDLVVWCVAIVVRIYEGVSWLCVSWLLVSLFFRREASERTQHFVVHAWLG